MSLHETRVCKAAGFISPHSDQADRAFAASTPMLHQHCLLLLLLIDSLISGLSQGPWHIP